MGDLNSLLNICNHTGLKIWNHRPVSTVCNLSAQKVSSTHAELISRTWAALALQGAEVASPLSCLPWRRIGGSNNPWGWKLRKRKNQVEEEGKVAHTGSDWISDTA